MSPDRPAYTAKSPEKAGPPRIRFHDLQTHLRNHGAPERRGRENSVLDAGPLLGGFHAGHLRPCDHRRAAESSPDDGEHPISCRLMLSATRSRWGQRLGQKKATP